MATLISPEQQQFIGYNDNGNESGSTAIAAVNTNWSQNVDANFRIRFTVKANAGTGGSSPIAATLWYSLNGGAWTQVTSSSSVVRLFTSANVADATATTQRISSGGFASGTVQTTSSASGSSSITSAGNPVTEDEWCVQIRGADVNNGDTVQLKQRSGLLSDYSTYTVTPSLTVVKTAPANNTKGFFVYL